MRFIILVHNAIRKTCDISKNNIPVRNNEITESKSRLQMQSFFIRK